MATSAYREEFSAINRASDGVRCEFHWRADYDDVAKTVTVNATDTPVGSSLRAILTATLNNGQMFTLNLLTDKPGGGAILNAGPVVFAGINLKLGTSKNVDTIVVTQDWNVNNP